MGGNMCLRVKFMGDLRVIVGRRTLDVEIDTGQTVGELLNILSGSLGEDFKMRILSGPGKLQNGLLVFVDGVNIQDCGGLSARLGGGEVEMIMLPMYGGGKP